MIIDTHLWKNFRLSISCQFFSGRVNQLNWFVIRFFTWKLKVYARVSIHLKQRKHIFFRHHVHPPSTPAVFPNDGCPWLAITHLEQKKSHGSWSQILLLHILCASQNQSAAVRCLFTWPVNCSPNISQVIGLVRGNLSVILITNQVGIFFSTALQGIGTWINLSQCQQYLHFAKNTSIAKPLRFYYLFHDAGLVRFDMFRIKPTTQRKSVSSTSC